MQPEQQQRILGYFIEEAREHLEMIEQSLLNLSRVVREPDQMNELFRAAHSLKGGAAMLGIASMQQIAHQLEDCFKLLQDDAVPVDQQLESLFLRVFDVLSERLEALQTSSYLSDAAEEQALAVTRPLFADLKAHLEELKQAVPEQPLASLDSLSTRLDRQTSVQTESLPEEDLTDLDNLEVLFGISDPAAKLSDPTADPELPAPDLEDLDRLLQTWGVADDDQPALEPVEILDFLDQLWPETAPAEESTPSEILDTLSDLPQPGSMAAAPDPPEALVQDLDFDLAMIESDSGDLKGDDLADLLIEIDAAVVPGKEDGTESNRSREIAAASSPGSAEDSAPEPQPPTEIAPPRTLAPTVREDLDFHRDRQATRSSSRGARAVGDHHPPNLGKQTLRVPVKTLDTLNNLVGELVISRNSLGQNQDRLRQFLANLFTQVHQLNELGQQMQETYERSLLELSLGDPRGEPSLSPALEQSSVPADQPQERSRFDALEMDRFTHFHRLSQEIIERLVRVREAAADIEFVSDQTDQVLSGFRQTTLQLQEGLTHARMVPFAQVADRLPRAVRALAPQWGKQANLEIEGRETLIDKVILERLYDPLTHLVNNALIHGIELPTVRRAAGKPLPGLIKLRAQHQGNQTIISLTDDGAGIDLEQVKAKALTQGLLTDAEIESASPSDLYKLLFHPGFSTLEQPHELAGRGVGLDAVCTGLAGIQGTISVDSSLGRGTSFAIRLPLTLSISKALCCVTNHQVIAFPVDSVEDMQTLGVDQIPADQEQRLIAWRGSNLPCRRLSDLLVYPPFQPFNRVYGVNPDPDQVSVVILRGGVSEVLAVQVDRVLAEQEIVIKPLPGPLPKPAGIAGASILGDGQVILVADALELIDLACGRLQGPTADPWQDGREATAAPAQSEPGVLIVDDSITVRELLSLTFSKFGYRVEQARDGQEAWDKLCSGLPCDLIFCDIEMPRMDGLELLTRVQQHPDLSHLPLAMLTSRGSERHRQMAARLGAKAYFTKPYLEESLLDACQRLLQGETLLGE